MICHLIPDEKFTEKVITFFNNYYDEDKHFFIVYNENFCQKHYKHRTFPYA